MKSQAYTIELFGVIQGVGFRPFVYRLAQSMNLKGYVQNRYDRLFIYIETSHRHILDDFLTSLLDQPPQNAHITHYRINDVLTLSPFSHNGFEIRDSQNMPSNAPCSLPLDTRPCEKCLADMRSNGRFKNYAFTTCTHCGARYTILNALPYDRIHTSMCDFPMCEECSSEYSNAFNRRFHAQPISCNMCAIRMRLIDKNGKIHTYKDARDDIKLIRQVAQAIEVGKILAIKGVGGFNLIANASNVETIATLRTRKNRPKKPFALMFKDLAQIESLSAISPLEREALLSPQAPIVLLRRHFQKGGILSEEALSLIAPDVSTLGAILPYNGIMHLLFRYIHTPLIFTSANLASSPIITDIDTLLETFCGANALIDMVLDYDREILHGADDSIMRLMAGDMRPLRLGRGYAPCNLSLPLRFQADGLIVGMGAGQKSTLSFVDSNQVLISPYIGDLQSVDSIKRYEKDFTFFSTLYKQDIGALVYDLHPQYPSTQKALAYGNGRDVKKYALSHHKAHFYALLAESNALEEAGIGIIWDGTGLGEDRHIWGGECFLYQPNGCGDSHTMERIYHFDEFVLLGGESSIKDIGKLALSLMWHYDIENIAEIVHFTSQEIELLAYGYERAMYPLTSSVGRIIDAVAYILGIVQIQSYEGQSGALLESYAYRDSSSNVVPYEFVIENDVISLDSAIKSVIADRANPCLGARRFLETLAQIALTLAKTQKIPFKVYFSGGVFQNKFLCDKIHDLFTTHHIPFYMHQKLPCNDASISLGQAVFGILQS
ncbi:carbamoyltransferase HypF [uncultured Helicobacter sp.]|uniref:carbamoyltransferase HypF n=2 Tax=uncultured Helicobacter sp. TaxID=175537 RepID=UPI00260E62A5|nr:carbamoyltransferase HypF [uncultured Helicobacter sp.]